MSKHRRRSEIAKRWTKLAAVPVGVMASGAVVLGATHATVTASTWSSANTVESGSWVQSKVTSDHGTSAVINAKDLKPKGGDWADLKYDFLPSAKDGGKESWGQFVLKGITATDSQGKPVSIPSDSELAKHLTVDFYIDRPNDDTEDVNVEKTLAEWYEDGKANGGRAVFDRFKLDRDHTDAPENKRSVQIGWFLEEDAPAGAQLSGVTFDFGAEIDVVS